MRQFDDNNFRDHLNRSFYNDVLNDSVNSFKLDPEKAVYHLNEIRLLREELYGINTKNPEQLPLLDDEIKGWEKLGKRGIYETGHLLTLVKLNVVHGQFKKYIKEHYDFSYESANNFMNVYKVCFKFPELVQTFKRSLLYGICALGFPKDLRKHLFDNGPPYCTCEELEALAMRVKKGEFELDGPEIKALHKYRNNLGQYEQYKNKINIRLNALKALYRRIQNEKNVSEWPFYQNRKKLILTEKQAEEIELWRENMCQAIDELVPDYEIENVKPIYETTSV